MESAVYARALRQAKAGIDVRTILVDAEAHLGAPLSESDAAEVRRAWLGARNERAEAHRRRQQAAADEARER